MTLSSIPSTFEYGDENRNKPTKPSSEAATSASTYPTSSHNHRVEESERQGSTSSRCDLRPGLSEDCVPGPPIRSNRLRRLRSALAMPSPRVCTDWVEPHTIPVIPALRSTNHELFKFFDSIEQSTYLFPANPSGIQSFGKFRSQTPNVAAIVYIYVAVDGFPLIAHRWSLIPKSNGPAEGLCGKLRSICKTDNTVSLGEGSSRARIFAPCERTTGHGNDGTRVVVSPLHPGSPDDPGRTLDGDAFRLP